MTEHADGLGLDDGLWLTITELAEHKGLGKPWISERVKALEADGKIETRQGKGKTKLVNLAQFDRAVGAIGDAVKEGAAAARAEIDTADTPASPVLRDHQARAAQYTADLKYLDLEERLGRLIPIDDVKAGGVKLGEAVVRILGRLPTYAEGMNAACIKDGVPASRALFKDIERDLRTAIVEAWAKIMSVAVPLTIETSDDAGAS